MSARILKTCDSTALLGVRSDALVPLTPHPAVVLRQRAHLTPRVTLLNHPGPYPTHKLSGRKRVG